VDNSIAQPSAIEVLELVRSKQPSARRVLLTDHCDLGIIVQGLHTGSVQHIVYKPIFGPELLQAIGALAPTAMNNSHREQPYQRPPQLA
jgi:DNA-binding NarL/FixJ family response regulator